MWSKAKANLADLRAVLSGWLAVALLAPTLFAMAPQPVFTPTEQLFHDIEAAICSQTDQASHQGRQHHGGHDQDCPCCLPGGLAHHVAPLLEPTTVAVVTVVPRLIPAFVIDWTEPVRRVHDYRLAPQRGPPSVSSTEA